MIARLILPSLVLVVLAVAPVGAQPAEGARAGVTRPAEDSAQAARRTSRTAPRIVREEPALPGDTARPPVTPGRAFLYSFLVPGAGQAKLDRRTAGGMFFLIEVSALTLVHRSAEDLRIARRFAGDSVPFRYQVNGVTGQPVLDADGAPVVAEWRAARYDAAFVRTRRLHYEDWLAVIAFNHLAAGADAFVAAQLWDLPGKVAIRQAPFGPLILQASFSFR